MTLSSCYWVRCAAQRTPVLPLIDALCRLSLPARTGRAGQGIAPAKPCCVPPPLRKQNTQPNVTNWNITFALYCNVNAPGGQVRLR